MLLLLMYGFALLQMSFFVHFFPAGLVVNFIVLAVLVLSFFARQDSYASFAGALIGGSFLDIFSGGFFIGFWAGALLSVSLVIQTIIKRYVRFPIPQKF